MSRPSLADRLAAVAGPQVNTSAAIIAEAAPAPAPAKQMTRRAPVRAEPPQIQMAAAPTTPKARDGKTMVAGYFSPQMARSVKILAVERDTTVQALIGEGLDMVLHKYGKHPMGER
jgi:hypothetical protein